MQNYAICVPSPEYLLLYIANEYIARYGLGTMA